MFTSTYGYQNIAVKCDTPCLHADILATLNFSEIFLEFDPKMHFWTPTDQK